MKKTTLASVILLFGFILGTNSITAQSDLETADTFSKLGECIRQSEDKYEDSGSAERSLRKIRKSFDFIRSKWLGTSNRKELPQQYLKTLDINCESLTQAVKTNDQNEAIKKIKIVQEDLDLKEKAARSGANAGENMTTSLNITVRTFKDGKEISGYSVGFNPQLYADNEQSLFPFNSDTSPSTGSLPPGYYILFIKKNGQKIAQKPISIGEQDDSDTNIKISVP